VFAVDRKSFVGHLSVLNKEEKHRCGRLVLVERTVRVHFNTHRMLVLSNTKSQQRLLEMLLGSNLAHVRQPMR
jgi:hypothetical protein